MVLFGPSLYGPLRHVSQFHKHAAGAELNFTVGLSRLGLRCGLITRVGRDEFGQYIMACMRAEGIDTALVREEETHPTGVYFKEYRGLGDPRVYYYRHGSAASSMSPEDIDPECLNGARLIHLTGITPALSATCRETCLALLRLAEGLGIAVSFDPNIRLGTLHDVETARDSMMPFISRSHLLLLNKFECELLFGSSELAAIMDEVFDAGPRIVAVKMGSRGSLAAARSDRVIQFAEPFKTPRYVDPVGAGDGFDAGFVYGYLNNLPIDGCMRAGNLVGALATTVTGDYEGYPFLRDVAGAIASGGSEIRR